MATTLNSGSEVLLYSTRATRTTGEFSRLTLDSFFRSFHRSGRNTGVYRVSVSWGTEEAFTIPSLPVISRTEAPLAEQP